MVEAGADEVPEDVLLEALDLAHAEIRKLCEAQEELREKAGKAKWLDPELTQELESSHGEEIRRRIQEHGLREAGAVVEELVDQLAPPLSMDSTDEDIRKQLQSRSSLAIVLERSRLAAVESAVREQFENDLRALTDAEQDSKELKSAKRQLLFERIIETVQLPFPVGPATVDGEAPVVKDTLTKQFVKRAAEAIYKDLVRKKIAVEKRRPDGRDLEEIRPIECEVGVSAAHARVGALHARADADHVAAHARYGQGGPADRRPVARVGAPVHAPLQLPALLGRGDGLHARAEAARHRSRCARAALARGGDPAGRATSRTRSGSSPRRSSRTARRRWARSAARPSR